MILDEARIAMNTRRGKVAGAIERDEVMAIEVDVVFEDLSALEAAEDVGESGSEVDRIEGVEDASHLRIAGNVFDLVDGSEVVVGLMSSFVEGEQGGFFEGEHGERSHGDVTERIGDGSGSVIGEGVESLAELLEDRVGAETIGNGCVHESQLPRRVVKVGHLGEEGVKEVYETMRQTTLRNQGKSSRREWLVQLHCFWAHVIID
jgi:hypothetical protein